MCNRWHHSYLQVPYFQQETRLQFKFLGHYHADTRITTLYNYKFKPNDKLSLSEMELLRELEWVFQILTSQTVASTFNHLNACRIRVTLVMKRDGNSACCMCITIERNSIALMLANVCICEAFAINTAKWIRFSKIDSREFRLIGVCSSMLCNLNLFLFSPPQSIPTAKNLTAHRRQLDPDD